MGVDGKLLAVVADRLIPGYLDLFDWGDIWEKPKTHGTAFEWTILAALAAQACRRGWGRQFPPLGLEGGSALFTLRNEIPRHHGAQPGHSAQLHHTQNLANRFLQAFTPKLLLEKDGRYLSVFREGCPYHYVMDGGEYKERPDILILPGRATVGFPVIVDQGEAIDFSFE